MAYNSLYTGPQVDEAVGAVREKASTWDDKQDNLSGTEDQIVGFNSAGEAVPVAAPNPLPNGGTAGQVLTKTEDGEAWQDAPDGLPEGGTDGQILAKTADGVAWEDKPVMYVHITGGEESGSQSADKTYTELYDAYQNGFSIFAVTNDGVIPLSHVYPKNMFFTEFDIHKRRTNEYLVKEDSVTYQHTVLSLAGVEAYDVDFINSYNGFTADNVQSAIEEVNDKTLPTGGTPGQMLYQGESGPEWGDKPVMQVFVTTDGDGYKSDKTFSKIMDAMESGSLVYAVFVGNIIPLSAISSLVAAFYTASFYNGANTEISIRIKNDDSVSVEISEITVKATETTFSPGTTGLEATNVQSAIEEVNEKIPSAPKSVAVTLSASAWSNNSQTVTVQGVETSGQSVRISPATKTDADNWVAAGVWCSEPTTANQLVFTCDTAPTENININVELQEVQS